jgi:hypothetical protein
MDKKKARIQELLKKKKQALEKIAKAKLALGRGDWHEDSTYDIADMDFRFWSVTLEEIEKELKELEKSKS